MPRVPKTFDAKYDGIQILNAIRNADRKSTRLNSSH